jgi:hypothetical protein
MRIPSASLLIIAVVVFSTINVAMASTLTVTSWNYQLQPGFNWVSIPVIPLDAKANQVFPQQEIKNLWYANPALVYPDCWIKIKDNGVWKDPNFCIKVGDAYMIETTKVISISTFGVAPDFPFTIPIRTRMGEERADFIGIPGTTNVPWSEVKVYGLDIVRIREYDAVNQITVDHYPPFDTFTFVAGNGYGVMTRQPGVILFYSSILGMNTGTDTDLQNQLSSALTNISNLNNQLSTLQSQINTLQNDKSILQSQVNTVQNDKNTLQSQVNTLQNDKNILQSQVNTLQSQTNSSPILLYGLGGVALLFLLTTVYLFARKK